MEQSGSVTMLSPRNSRSGYKTILGDINSTVIVGGVDINSDEFVPAVNLSCHNDEFWMDINHAGSTKVNKPGISEGVIDCVCPAVGGGSDFCHRFKSVGINSIKWDMIFNSPKDVPGAIDFAIKHSGNVSFYKQVLTPEDIAGGCTYSVPEASGSYAIYGNRRGNKYKTGKIAHIYTPFFIDEVGARSPLLSMKIIEDTTTAATLTLTITPEVQAWLDAPARVGKIILDPTLGYDTKGASSIEFSYNGSQGYGLYTATENGTVAGFSCYHQVNSGASTRMAIYKVTGSPHTIANQPRYARSVQGVLDNSEFTTMTVENNDLDLVAGETYLILVAKVNGDIRYYFDNVPGLRGSYWPGLDTLPDPAPAVVSDVNSVFKMSFWVEYTATAGGGAPAWLLDE